jgi:O-antigen/teichoic acid export membrane protein
MHWELGLWTLARAVELGLIILITQQSGTLAALIGAKAFTMLLFVVAVWATVLLHFRLPFRSGRALVRPLVMLSLPVGATLLLMMVQLKGDILLIGWMRGTSDAGLFGAVAQIPELVVIANGLLFFTTAPLLAQCLGRGDTRQFQAVFQRFFDLLILVLPGLAVWCCFLADPLVRIGFGVSYTVVVPQFRILVCVGAVIPIAGLMGVAALTLNLQRQQVTIELANACIYLAANLLLLRVFGTIASAWIRLVVVLLGPTWTYALIRAHADCHLSLKRLWIAGPVAGIAAAVMAATLPFHPLITAAAGLVTYGALLVCALRWSAARVQANSPSTN